MHVFSSPTPSHPHYFCVNLDELQNPYFQKEDYIHPRPLHISTSFQCEYVHGSFIRIYVHLFLSNFRCCNLPQGPSALQHYCTVLCRLARLRKFSEGMIHAFTGWHCVIIVVLCRHLLPSGRRSSRQPVSNVPRSLPCLSLPYISLASSALGQE